MKQLTGNDHRSLIEIVKVWIDTTQGIATILAIIAGGYWFFLQRGTKPQIKLEQTVTQRAVAGEPHETLIVVDVRVTNTGKVKVDLDPGELELMQVNPIPTDPKAALLDSFELKRVTLEPGESDQALFRDDIVPDSIKTIQVHSDYKVPTDKILFWNLKDKNMYWNLLSFVDIDANASHAESVKLIGDRHEGKK
jgi:hypothetical protein